MFKDSYLIEELCCKVKKFKKRIASRGMEYQVVPALGGSLFCEVFDVLYLIYE